MAIKAYKPTTAGRRQMTNRAFVVLTGTQPTRALLQKKTKVAGRNHAGKITIRHRGGGTKRFYRLIQFGNLPGSAVVKSIEYDPNRSAYIALVQTELGLSYYVLAASGMKIGQK